MVDGGFGRLKREPFKKIYFLHFRKEKIRSKLSHLEEKRKLKLMTSLKLLCNGLAKSLLSSPFHFFLYDPV